MSFPFCQSPAERQVPRLTLASRTRSVGSVGGADRCSAPEGNARSLVQRRRRRHIPSFGASTNWYVLTPGLRWSGIHVHEEPHERRLARRCWSPVRQRVAVSAGISRHQQEERSNALAMTRFLLSVVSLHTRRMRSLRWLISASSLPHRRHTNEVYAPHAQGRPRPTLTAQSCPAGPT